MKTQIEYIKDARNLFDVANLSDTSVKRALNLYKQARKILSSIPTEGLPFSEINQIDNLLGNIDEHETELLKSKPLRKDTEMESTNVRARGLLGLTEDGDAKPEDLIKSEGPVGESVILNGKARKEGFTVDKADELELAKGIAIEMEHTDDPEVAKTIALDHLAEYDTYYSALEKMEADLEAQSSKQ